MKKTKAKDILFDSEIQLSSSMAKHSLIKYFDILIALLGVLGVTYVFISSFNIEVNNVLIIGCIVCSVLFFSFVFKKSELFKYTLTSTLVVFGISIFVFYRRLYDGFILTSSLAMQAQKKDSTLSVFYNDNFLLKNNGLSITIFFEVIIFLISALICFSIIYKPSFMLFFLLSVPILELGLYFEVMPSYPSIIMLIVSWASVLGMGTINNKKIIDKFRFNKKREKHIFFSNKTNRSIMTKVGTIIGVITGVIILLTLIICPPSSYKCPDNITRINLSVQAFIENFNYENFTDDLRGVAKGGVNGGKLGTVDKIKYKNETALEVTAPWLGNNIYLKGFIGCEYTGNSWEDIDDKTFSNFLNDNTSINGFNVNAAMLSMLDYSKIDIDKNYSADISISNINANKKFVYMPYSVRSANDNFSDDKILNKKETYLYFDNNETKYGFSFYPNSPNVNSFENIKNEINTQLNNNIETKIAGQKSIQNLITSEQKYTEFVDSEYTKLPEKGLEEIKNKYSGRYNEKKDLNACVNETIKAVTDGTTYDLAPGKLPRGKDFVEYFLYENKKGYCTHYASAAAVILRAMGVPTRYVEGYVINKNDVKNADSTLQSGMVKNKFTILDEEEALKTFKISREQYEKQRELLQVMLLQLNLESLL